MRTLRVIDTGIKPARWNIAVTAALTEFHRAGRIPDTLRFHRYPRSVLLGRNQILDQEIRADRCLAKGVEIARRVTGGGAVYMSPSVLAWDIVLERSAIGWQLADAVGQVCSCVAGGLRRLGLPARFRAPGDVVIDGRKVSGSSGGFDGPVFVHQGTVLLDFNKDEMAAVLKARPGRAEPAARVASLAGFLGRVPSVGEVRDALLAAFCDAWRVTVQNEELGADERALAEKLLVEELDTEEFVAGAPAAAADLLATEDARSRTGALP